jgi:hypothetical protein
MAAEDILAALQGLKYAPIESPYGIAGASLAQSMPQMITPTMSTGKALGLSLGSVLLSGLLGYQARRDAAAANLESAKLGLQLQSAMTPEARLGIIEQAGGGTMGDLQSRLLDYNNILATQEAARKLKNAEKLADLTTAAEFEISPLAEKVAEAKATREAEAKRKLISALTPDSSSVFAGTEGKPLTDIGATQAKRDALISRGITMGMTPGQAADYAEKALKPDTAFLKDAQKKIEASRQRGTSLEEIAATARAGMEGAGMTGGLLAGPRELASKALSVVSPTEQEKRDYQTILDSIRPQVVKMMRSPGAVSDFETKLLMGAGPSSTNTPSENARLIANMESVAQLEQDYADFLEQYVQGKGTATGADALWRQYKSEQVFPAGTYNPQRQDWQSWLAENAGTGAVETPETSKLKKLQQLQNTLDELRRLKAAK